MTTSTQNAPDWRNRLHFGDNLPIMREHIPDESVDLIYLDLPFNSNATYNVLFREYDSSKSAAHFPILAYSNAAYVSRSGMPVRFTASQTSPR